MSRYDPGVRFPKDDSSISELKNNGLPSGEGTYQDLDLNEYDYSDPPPQYVLPGSQDVVVDRGINGNNDDDVIPLVIDPDDSDEEEQYRSGEHQVR